MSDVEVHSVTVEELKQGHIGAKPDADLDTDV